MNKIPLISIIIICYNYEQYLHRALHAIKKQNYDNYEIIYVDDASTDASLKIAEEFKEKNPQLLMRIITMEANDVNRANILAFRAARGKYVLKNDADDWLEPGALQAYAEAVRRTDADMIVGLYQEVSEDNRIIRKRKFSKNPVKWSVCEQQAGIYKTNILCEAIIAVPPDYVAAGDAYFVAQFCLHCKNVCFIDQIVHNYFFHKNSSWNGGKQFIINSSHNSLAAIIKIIDMYCHLAGKAGDRASRDYLSYAAVKKYYEAVVRLYCDSKWKYANRNRKLLKNRMKEKFPGYMRNPMITLHENGYHAVPRFLVWALCQIDRLGLWFIIYLAVSIKRPDKYIQMPS